MIILLSLSLWYATGATGPLSCKSHWNSHEANDNGLNEKLNWCYALLDGYILELNCSFSFLGFYCAIIINCMYNSQRKDLSKADQNIFKWIQ